MIDKKVETFPKLRQPSQRDCLQGRCKQEGICFLQEALHVLLLAPEVTVLGEAGDHVGVYGSEGLTALV